MTFSIACLDSFVTSPNKVAYYFQSSHFLCLGLSATEQSTTAPNQTSIKLRNEAFRCFHVAARRFADKIVYYLLHKMQNEKDSTKLGAVWIENHVNVLAQVVSAKLSRFPYSILTDYFDSNSREQPKLRTEGWTI